MVFGGECRLIWGVLFSGLISKANEMLDVCQLCENIMNRTTDTMERKKNFEVSPKNCSQTKKEAIYPF
jgi:hypothetical protein